MSFFVVRWPPARPSLFICEVMRVVLRSGFRDTSCYSI